VLAIPLRASNRSDLIAVGIFAVQPITEPADLEQESPWFDDAKSLHQVPYCDPKLLLQLGEAVTATIYERAQLSIREAELKQLAGQLTRNYEEITMLHQLARDAQISLGTGSLQQMTLSLLAEILPVPQVVYVSRRTDENSRSQGEPLLDAGRCRELRKALGSNSQRSVLVDNHLMDRRLPAQFAGVGRVISVPVLEGKDLFGWLVALGRKSDRDLGSVEASLMSAVASILATHQTNVQLYRDIKDLFLGVVRALTSAIDAKDPYTSGHSERVARLSYQIAQRMGLPEDQQNKVYLSGLLHDVGKIGIRDSILLKPGRLTDEEMAHMKQHPCIGYDILSPVRQLQPVLSGVRSHHENFDGTGYPDGLRGDEISLMARIVSAADSYDAMSSGRPYRPTLEQREIMQIMRNGCDQQWDRSVVTVLLSILEESDVEETLNVAPGASHARKVINAIGPTPWQSSEAVNLAPLR
jgi:HD-GYP domain-containing protein (c-di-GMP phosphodiesterase class II)